MRILDRLLGKPSIAGLAAEIIREVKNAGVSASLRFDSAENRIVHATSSDENWVFNLGNIYQSYKNIPRAERAAFVRATVQSILITRKELPDDFDLVRADVRPRLWLRVSFEQMRLRGLVEADDVKPLDLPSEPIGEHLLLSLAYDWPHAVQSINAENLETWDVSFYEAMELARHNLREATQGYAEIGTHFYSFMSGDSYDASRIALIDRIESLEVSGSHVAMVPNRDTLLISGTDDVDGLQLLTTLAHQALSQPYPLSGVPLILEDGQWQDWIVPEEHPSHSAFQQLKITWLAPLYEQQENDLKQLFRKQGTDLFVARYFVAETKEGALASYCVWGRGVNTLLPETEQIAFFQSEAIPPLFAAWSKVSSLCEHLMHRTDDYPARYRVSEFPESDLLDKLAAAQGS